MLKVHETTTADGIASVFLRYEDGVLALVSRDGAFPLPEGGLEAVMARYGAPLDAGERLIPVGSLALGEGASISHVRHLARYDVIARDYLVFEAPGSEPCCALANTIAGALAHLGRAAKLAG